MQKEELEKIENSIVCCPYCKELFRVASGWFFADHLDAKRDPKKMLSMYVSNYVRNEIKIEDENETVESHF